MVRVLHTGDTHLGYRQYHSPTRRADFLEAFRLVVEDAIESDVAGVVHAGDLFHDRRPPLEDVHGAIAGLRELRAADIPFFAVVGNHERTRGEQWLDLFETLGLATRLGRSPVVLEGLALYGLDYVPRSGRDELEYDFAPCEAEHAALVGHGLFTPFNTEWDLSAVLEASPVDFDAVLLGDDHDPDTAQLDGTWVTYCGSTERTSAAERAERGYNLVDFDGSVSISRRGIPTRPFVFVEAELGSGEGAERVRERIREADVEDAVVIVTLEGEGGAVPSADLERFAVDRGALVARVADRRAGADADSTAAVSFVDPADAVRDRLRDLGLSEAARTVDTTVRDVDGVPKSNVRDRVHDRIEALFESEPAAFEPAAEGEEAPAVEAGESADAATGPDEESDPSGDQVGPESAAPGASAATDDDAPTPSDESTDETTAGPRPTTMEEFL